MTNYLAAQFPLSMALKMPVIDAGPGFDMNDLKKKLGATRYANLLAGLKRDFVCNHAKYPAGDQFAGSEVHCAYAADVEAFLKAGG